ncbi:MAG: divalent-cation tolerance protein CutA [Candidatus Anammoxibacter sp.]
MDSDNTEYIVVLITTSSIDEAKKIGSSLINKNLAACTNIMPSVQSLFRWKGDVCDETEILIMAKTRLDLFDKLQAEVKELHSYEVPEIIALPIIKGNKDYLKWVDTETNH